MFVVGERLWGITHNYCCWKLFKSGSVNKKVLSHLWPPRDSKNVCSKNFISLFLPKMTIVPNINKLKKVFVAKLIGSLLLCVNYFNFSTIIRPFSKRNRQSISPTMEICKQIKARQFQLMKNQVVPILHFHNPQGPLRQRFVV